MKSLNRYNSTSELGASYGLLPTLSVNYIEEKDSVFITDKEKHFYVQSLEDGNVFSFGADTWLGQKSEHISYSKDSIDWFPLSSVESLTINAGECILLKSDGTNLQKEDFNKSPLLTSSLTFNAFGNIKEFLHPNDELQDYGYYYMFRGTKVVDASKLLLPATTLASECYQYMFSGCKSLTTSPELPATTLAFRCYSYMFYGCTSLTTALELHATTTAYDCYSYMFYNCSKLSSITCYATDISANNPAAYWVAGVASSGTFTRAIGVDGWTTGEDGIPEGWTVQDYVPNNYVTFTAEEDSTIGLTSLSSNQKLLYSKDQSTWSLMDTTTSISLASGESAYIVGMLSANNTSSDYTQFSMTGRIAASGNCNALWNYIDVNAALKTYCGHRMFQGCSSLTSTPELPATTLANDCYYSMFSGCTSLATAPELPATRLAGGCYQYMFNGCTFLTTAPALPATKISFYCYNSMFRNCTSLTTAPALPATSLSEHCYKYMFENCTSLTTAPELPATILAYYGYYYMFNGCSNLSSITCHATNIIAGDCTTNWVNGVASSGTFTKAASMTSWGTGKSSIPEGWTVQDYVES